MKRKKICMALMAGLVLCSSSIVNAEVGGMITRTIEQPVAIAEPIAIDNLHFVLQINNRVVDISKNQPYRTETAVMLPLKSVLENLGYTINWDEEKRAIVVKEQEIEIIRINVDNKDMALKGDGTIPVNMEIKEGRSFVPMDFFEDFLKAKVSMDETGVIKISTESNIELPEILGTVEEVKNLEGQIRVLVKEETEDHGALNEVMLSVDEDTTFIGIKKEEIKEGMKLKVSYGPIITRSIPAQSVARKVEAVDAIASNQNLIEGKITEIEDQKDSRKILVGDFQEGMYLIVSKDTEIVDENGDTLKAEELQKDMSVKAYHSNIMTMSLPPISQALKIVICEK